MKNEDYNLIQDLAPEQLRDEENRLRNFYPGDAKYAHKVDVLREFLTPKAEILMCAEIQLVMLALRKKRHLDHYTSLIDKMSAVNVDLIEGKKTHHDQLAVIKELGRHMDVSLEALLHPGTTSYDILDTARNALFRLAWFQAMRPVAVEVKDELVRLAEMSMDIIAAGRTHLQLTAPVLYGRRFSRQAQIVAEQIKLIDEAANDLRGKIAGIVGTGAGLDMVLGDKLDIQNFEEDILKVYNLKPDHTSSQIVQKQRLARFAHQLASLGISNSKFANDIRLLYSSGIGEVTSQSNKERLGGSSSDATKNNPINWENIAATATTMKAGMTVIYDMMMTDLERDLRDSKLARMQPQMMMVDLYESLVRMRDNLCKVVLVEDKIAENLQKVRDKPGDAMTTILRGEGFTHPDYGTGHDFVKEAAKKAQQTGKTLLETALEDDHFKETYENLPETKQLILKGELEHYLGFEKERVLQNISYAKAVKHPRK